MINKVKGQSMHLVLVLMIVGWDLQAIISTNSSYSILHSSTTGARGMEQEKEKSSRG